MIIFWFTTFKTTSISCKPLRIRFDKIDGFIKVYNGTMCLVLMEVKNMISSSKGWDILLE